MTKYFRRQFLQLRNRNERKFESVLFEHLRTRGIQQQELFQNHLDLYKTLVLRIEPNLLAVDVEKEFGTQLAQSFKDLSEAELTRLSDKFTPIDTTALFAEELKELQRLLKSRSFFTEERLQEFLANNKRRSLLYFGRTKHLKRLFEELYKPAPTPNSDKPPSNEDEISLLAAQASSAAKTPIESVLPSSLAAVPQGSRNGRGSTGRRHDGGANDTQNKLSGLFAEMLVYRHLAETRTAVKWVSKNASKVPPSFDGYNPEGDDILGYDIEYLDENSNKHYVEVKGRSNDIESFDISRNELEKALEVREFYHLFFVTHLFDDSLRRVRDLGNLFLLDAGADFFANDRFTVDYKNLEIRFHQFTEPDE